MRGRVRQIVAACLGAAVGFAGISGTPGVAHALSTPAAALSALTVDPASSTGAFSVPVSAIPGQAFHSQDNAGAGPVQSVGVGHIGVGHIGVGHIGVGHIGVGHIGVGQIGVGHIALVDRALRN